MHARAMVLLTLLSSAGSLVLTASFAEGPSPKSVPTYKVVAGWPEPSGPIKLGQVSAVATDASDRVFVFHRGEPPVVVFDRDGKYLRSWGEGLVKKAHGLRIDREQNVWTTDVGHHLVRKFDHEGTLLMTLGRQGVPGDGPRPVQPADRRRESPPRASSSSPTATATRGSCCSRRTAATSRSGGRRARAKASSTCRTPSSSTRTVGSTWATARTTASRCSTPRASSSPSGRRGVPLRPLPHRRPPPLRGRRPRQPRDRPRPERQGASALGRAGRRSRPVRDAACRLRRLPRRRLRGRDQRPAVAEVHGEVSRVGSLAGHRPHEPSNSARLPTHLQAARR